MDFFLFSYQEIDSAPIFFKNTFVLEKCLLPNQPLQAPSGDGCGAVKIQCFEVSINLILPSANFPQSKKTTFSFSFEIFVITTSVNFSQPLFWCDPASCALTVKVAFNNKTP